MKDSQVLRLARVRLANGSAEFICTAINEVEAAPHKQRERLQAWISSMLLVDAHQYETYCSWLRRTHPEHAVVNYKEALPGRLAWMDWMIDTLESEGK
jgi:uncharacterized short protein YbdD (DUF466 family)